MTRGEAARQAARAALAKKVEARRDAVNATAANATAILVDRNGGKKKRGPRFVVPADSFVGRIDAALARIGKTRGALNRHTGIAGSALAALARHGAKRFKTDERMEKVARFLGVTAHWLEHGGDMPTLGRTAVVKANGHAPPSSAKLDAAMHGSADRAMLSVWNVLPLDVKLHLVATVNELIAQHLGRQ